jgi:hypothetical protein
VVFTFPQVGEAILPVFWGWLSLVGEENTTASTLPAHRAGISPYACCTCGNSFHIFYKISAKIGIF